MRGGLALVAALGTTLAAAAANACSFVQMQGFEPDFATFQPRRDAQGLRVSLPAPDVTVLEVTRGSASAGTSCDDAGVVQLRVKWPRGGYALSEVGFYFRVVGGEDRNHIFPPGPMMGFMRDGGTEFLFAWLDGHPSQQQPLDLRVEIFAVNHGLEIGPATQFNLTADVSGNAAARRR